jgi:Co/Zn/Cd efflux system component
MTISAQAADHAASKRKLQIAVVLATVFTVAQFTGGVLSGSLAILADAVHMLTDLAGFMVALSALALSGRPASAKFTSVPRAGFKPLAGTHARASPRRVPAAAGR